MRVIVVAVLCLVAGTRVEAQTPGFASAAIAGITLSTSSTQVLGAAVSARPRGHLTIEMVTPSAKAWCTFDGSPAVAGAAGTLVFSGEGAGFEWSPADGWVPQQAVNCVGSSSGVALTVISAP